MTLVATTTKTKLTTMSSVLNGDDHDYDEVDHRVGDGADNFDNLVGDRDNRSAGDDDGETDNYDTKLTVMSTTSWKSL